MTNWKAVDELWKSSSINGGGTFSMSENKFIHGVVTEYRIDFTEGQGTITYIGKLTKSNEGVNHHRTNLIYHTGQKNNSSHSVRLRKGIGRFFGKYSGVDFLGNNTKLLINATNVSRIDHHENVIDVRFDYIFSNEHDFEKAEELRKLLLVEFLKKGG